jgi:hypothetical protein
MTEIPRGDSRLLDPYFDGLANCIDVPGGDVYENCLVHSIGNYIVKSQAADDRAVMLQWFCAPVLLILAAAYIFRRLRARSKAAA